LASVAAMRPFSVEAAAKSLIHPVGSAKTLASCRITGYRDNWIFITPRGDLQEDNGTRCGLYVQVKCSALS
jgi:hypothetical protein